MLVLMTAPEWNLESGRGKRQAYKYIIAPWVSCSGGEGKCHAENNNGGGGRQGGQEMPSEKKIKHLSCNLKNYE